MGRFKSAGVCLGLGLLGLAGCSTDPNEFAPQCPVPSIIQDASLLTRYDVAGHDLTDLVLSGRMLGLSGACVGVEGKHTVKAHAAVEFDLTRGPAAKGRETDISYIVAVVRDEQVLDHHVYAMHVVFPANTDSVHVTGDTVDFLFPTPKGVLSTSYHIYFGFQLSPEELEANRHSNRS